MAVKGLKEGVTTIDVINSVRSSIIANNGLDYADRIPLATQDNLADVGKAIMQYKPIMNEFLDTLINRIGLVVIRKRMYKNKLAIFKRGFLEYGDSIEEIFVDIAHAINYEPAPPQDNLGDVWEQYKPKVVSAFHKINRENTYPVTINEALLKRAFTGYAQFDSFIAGIFDSIYNADEFDEYVLFKRLLGAVASNTYKIHVDMPVATNRATGEAFSIAMRSAGLQLEYMSRGYNQMGVATHTPLADQVLLLRSDIVPVIDVMVLANSFNMNLAQPISGRIIVIDDFGDQDANIVAMIVDKEFSMIYDTRFETTSIYNAKHLYWNYFLHHFQIISASPFANAIAFTTETIANAITSVTIEPATADVEVGKSITLNAVVDYTGTISTAVTWTMTGNTSDDTTITNGVLNVGADETAKSLTITATSVADTTKSGTSTITITNG